MIVAPMLLLLACTAPTDTGETARPADTADSADAGPYTLTLAGELALPGAMDVWGEGDVAVIAGGIHPEIDVLVADISDPTNPVQLATITGIGQVRDVDLQNGILVTGSDCNCQAGTPDYVAWDHVGIRLYDLTDPSQPELLAEIGAPTESVHNLMVADGYLYATSMLEKAVVIFDIRDPSAPVEVGRWRAPDGSPHDQTLVGETLYVAHVTGFSVVDVHDRSAPTTTRTVPVAQLDGGFTSLHNVWPLPDTAYVATSAEQIGGKLRLWNLDDGVPVAELPAGDELNCVHNAYVFNERLYAAWYVEGVRVFDVAEPTAPTLIGAYDTFPAEALAPIDNPDIRGAWGLWADHGVVVVGDTQRGMVILTEG